MKPLAEYNDLIQNIRKGDSQSLELLFRRLYPRLCAYANKFLNDMEDSEDIVQETFYKVWKNKNELDENKSIKSYLFTSIRNSCLNILQHKKTENQYARLMAAVYLDNIDEISPHESLVVEDIEKDFQNALDKLPFQCRRVFELNRLDGLKYHEIAEKLNISIKTVETQMSRALVKIRLQLKDHLTAHYFLLMVLLS